MKIPVKDLLKVDNIESYDVKFNRTDPLFIAIFIMGKKRSSTDSEIVAEENLKILQSNKSTSSMSVITNKAFRENLKKINPALFITPTGKMKIIELLDLAGEYETMNSKSHKQRKITILEDVISTDTQAIRTGKNLSIEYGVKLTLKTINKVYKNVNPADEVDYKDSEEGVLLFVPDAKNFKIKVDLLALLASLELEIYDANNGKDAIELYETKTPKLVILGGIKDNIDSKMASLELEKYDPFVKKLDYDKSPALNREAETKKIKSHYFSGYTKLLELQSQKKAILPERIKQNIISALNRLGNDYSLSNYVETAYTIKQFGRMFNITALWNILENIKQEASRKK